MTARVPDAIVAECIRLRVDEQLSTPTIARRVGICNYSVYRILRDHPWNPPKDRDTRRITRGKRWTTADVAYLHNAYPSLPREEITAHLDRKWLSIVKMAQTEGVKRHPLVRTPQAREVHPIFQQLRRAREFQGLTRDQLAERMGHTTGMILHSETGRFWPQFKAFLDWIDALGFDLKLEMRASKARSAA